MSFTDVGVVLRKELRETLRDRRTLAVMVLFPLVVYPLVSLLMAGVIGDKQAADEARVSRVAVMAEAGPAAEGADTAAALADIRARLAGADARIAIVVRPAATADDVVGGDLDALVALQAGPPGGPRTVRVLFDQTRESSEQAHARLESRLAAVLPAGCAPSYRVDAHNVAPRSKVGGYVLSKVLPLIVVVMTMLGAFYPAIDITAGERERGTLETLLASPVRRLDLMTGKVLAVATLATLTGVLNIASMSLTVAEGARLAGGGQALAIPWTRAAATVLTVIPAAFLFGAVMVAIGAMARGFKEAQSLLTPVYLLCFTPSLVASVADFQLSGPLLVVPGTNLTLLARDLMVGQATVGHTAVVLGSTLLVGGLALSLAARLYDSERLLAAPDVGRVGLVAWVRYLLGRGNAGAGPAQPTGDRAAGDSPRPGEIDTGSTAWAAVLLFALAFVLSFFVFPWIQRWRLIPGLLISQWGGFLGLVVLHARSVGRPVGDVVGWRRPRATAVVGAVAVGLSAWVILGVLADRVMPPPRQLIEEMRKLIRPPEGGRPLAVSLLALAATPAICEEALFRGPILRGLRRQFSAITACVITGVLFGFMHGDVWRFVPTSLLGVLLSWMALTTGSIVPSMIVHFLNNSALTILGYTGLDQAAENLSGTAELGILVGAIVLFGGGVAALRRGRRT